jgi:hypothetical protein
MNGRYPIWVCLDCINKAKQLLTTALHEYNTTTEENTAP